MSSEIFRILPGLPVYGPLPKAFSANGRGTHREGLAVDFLPETSHSWVGNFQPGGGSLNAVLEHPDGRHVIVVAQGQGYSVHPVSRELATVLQPNASLVLPLRDRNQILFSNDLWLELVGEDGLIWRTRRISCDGIQELHQEGDRAIGQSWSALDDSWHPFTVDLTSGQVDGGSYGIDWP